MNTNIHTFTYSVEGCASLRKFCGDAVVIPTGKDRHLNAVGWAKIRWGKGSVLLINEGQTIERGADGSFSRSSHTSKWISLQPFALNEERHEMPACYFERIAFEEMKSLIIQCYPDQFDSIDAALDKFMAAELPAPYKVQPQYVQWLRPVRINFMVVIKDRSGVVRNDLDFDKLTEVKIVGMNSFIVRGSVKDIESVLNERS